MSEKIECWKCGREYDKDNDFCPKCDADIEPNEPRFIPSKSKPRKEPQNIGGWVLRHNGWLNAKITDPPLYTRTCADLIKHKATGKKFKRGDYKLFWTSRGETAPTFVEDTDEYEFFSNAQFPFGLTKYEPKKTKDK